MHRGKKNRAFVAWTNSDLTEGKGWAIPLAVCLKKATAKRLGKKGGVQGCDCYVGANDIFWYNGQWYGPIDLQYPTVEDDIEQEEYDKKTEAIQKAKKLGLTDEEIKSLSGGLK